MLNFDEEQEEIEKETEFQKRRSTRRVTIKNVATDADDLEKAGKEDIISVSAQDFLTTIITEESYEKTDFREKRDVQSNKSDKYIEKQLVKLINPKKVELQKHQIKELKQAFDYLEDPESDFVHVHDLVTLIRACGFEPRENEIEELLNKIHPFYSGFLTFDEFVQIYKYKLSEKDNREEMERAFNLMDLNNSGRITLNNLQSIRQLLHFDINDEELEEMMHDAGDVHDDGVVSMKSFIKFMMTSEFFDNI